MIRGTTAYFKFVLPYRCELLKSAQIKFWQDYNDGPSASRPLPIFKVLSQCSRIGDNEISVSLLPEETLRFTSERKAYVQLVAALIEGTRFGSRKQEITVYPMSDGQDEAVDPDDIVPTPDTDGIVILDGQTIS